VGVGLSAFALVASGMLYEAPPATASSPTCDISTPELNVTVECEQGSWEDYYSGGSTWVDRSLNVTIPRGATTLTVDLKGGGGASSWYRPENGKTYLGSEGGKGARVQGTIDVTGMSTVTVVIGTGGEGSWYFGNSGGRFSAIYEGDSTDPDDVLFVAGGGGGGGSPYPETADCEYTFGSGGCTAPAFPLVPGGSGGADGTAAGGSPRSYFQSFHGGGGSDGVGGAAGAYPDTTDVASGTAGWSWGDGGSGGGFGSVNYGWGGSGGGGYGGGGGGAGSGYLWPGTFSVTGSGGAGGSYADPSATGVNYSPEGGDGGIQIRPEDNPTFYDQNGGWGSAELTFAGSKPDAPTSVTAEAGDGAATISWVAPTAADRVSADSYTVKALTGGVETGDTCSSTSTSANPSCTITGLDNGTEYTFTVTATNTAGSTTSSATSAVTPGTVPGAPTAVGVNTGSETVTVSFTAPIDDGGFTIADYEYKLNDGDWTSASTTGSPFTISSLDNGTNYAIRVRAVNSKGAGAASDPVNAQPESAATTPAAPTITSITPGNNQAQVAFSAGSDGGDGIINYEYSVDAANWVPLNPTDTTSPITISSGLSNGVTSSIEIRAVNGEGSGEASNSVSVTPGSSPLAPTIDSLTAGNESIQVAFTPGSDEGSTIIDYEYQLDGGEWVSAGTAESPFTIAGLDNGVSYAVVIRAVNAIGGGAGSTQVTATPKGVPSAPTLDSVTAEPGVVRFSWTAPGNNGGSSITEYEYSTDFGSTWRTLGQDSDQNDIAVSVDSSGETFTFGASYGTQVRAVNAEGAGTASSTKYVIPADVPGAPQGFFISPGNEILTLNWGSTASNGQPITDFEYTTNGGEDWASLSTNGAPVAVNEDSTSTPVDFTNGNEYTIQVRAVNAMGKGTASQAVSATPNAVPSAPYNLAATQGPQEIMIAFTAPEDGGSVITDYEYQLDEGAWTSANVTSSPMVILGLTNGQSYSIRIRARNDNGPGAISDVITASPVAPEQIPNKASGLSALPGQASLDLTWEPTPIGIMAVTDYQYTTNDGLIWKSLGTTGTTAQITTRSDNELLENGTEYTVKIRAVSSSDSGDASDPVSQTPGIPLAPGSVQSSWNEDDELELSWVSGGDNGFAISEYRLVVSQVSSRSGTLMARSGPGTYSTSSTSYAIPGLSPSSGYTITLTAKNTHGWGLSTTVSVGSTGSDDEEDQTPPAIIQQIGLPPSGVCEDVVDGMFGTQTFIQGGWGQSWARWMNSGLDGAVCTRILVYSNAQGRWVLAEY